jgi:2-O-methyltransferase
MKALSKHVLFLGISCITLLTHGANNTNKIHHLIENDADSLIRFIQPYLPHNPIILEAGAFDGSDTARLSRFWPASQIHAFEPVPEIYATLKKTIAGLHNISTYPIALSDSKGFATFYISEFTANPGIPGASGSLLAPKDHLERAPYVIFPKQIIVETLTIDQWAQLHNVDHIDFMWLDMQGHELTALKNSLKILPSVKIIYTEVEFTRAYEGQPLYKDVKEWLALHGFELLAIDFDEAEALKDHIPAGHEWFGNALFIRKN